MASVGERVTSLDTGWLLDAGATTYQPGGHLSGSTTSRQNTEQARSQAGNIRRPNLIHAHPHHERTTVRTERDSSQVQ